MGPGLRCRPPRASRCSRPPSRHLPWPSRSPAPPRIAVDSRGHMYVTFPDANLVREYAPNGAAYDPNAVWAYARKA